MMPKSLRWRLPLSYAGISLLATLALGAVLLLTLREFYRQQELNFLLGNATTIGEQVSPLLLEENLGQLPAQVEGLAFLSQARIQVYDPSQTVLLADSGSPQVADANAQIEVSIEVDGITQVYSQTNQVGQTISESTIVIESGGFNEEVTEILTDGEITGDTVLTTTSTVVEVEIEESGPLFSQEEVETLGRPLPVSGTLFGLGLGESTADPDERSILKVSAPVFGFEGNLIGYVHLSEGPAYGRRILQSVFQGWLIASLFAVVISGTAGIFASRRLTDPLQALTEATRQMAAGDLSARAAAAPVQPAEFGTLARSFDQMADQVEETILTLRQFVTDAAHELHTPLTALQTDLDLLAQSGLPPEDQSRLERAQAQAKRLQALTDSLLDLSRLEANHGQPPERLLLNELVHATGNLFASRAEQAEIEYVILLPEHDIFIEGDPGRLQQAISNLLDNALKFTPAGQSVTLELTQAHGEALVTVSDTGIGIPEDDRPLLFRRFHRGRNTQAYSGNGLGLAIVKAIVDGHNGTITAEAAASGSRFALKFPRVD